MDKYRKAIEIQKMIDKFNEANISVGIWYLSNYSYNDITLAGLPADITLAGLPVCRVAKEDTYDSLKKKYYELVKKETETEVIPLDLDEDTLTKLYEQADKSGKLIDEYITESLELYLQELNDIEEDIKQKEMELKELKDKKESMTSFEKQSCNDTPEVPKEVRKRYSFDMYPG